MEAQLAYLTLAHARGLGPRRIKLLIEAFGTAAAVLEAPAAALREVEGIGESAVKALREAQMSRWPAEELARARRLGVSLLYLEHPDYPAALRSIYDPPPLLYLRGALPPLPGVTPAAIAIVGARNASDDALHFARALAAELAHAGLTIISGLALGIDAAAHRGALESEGGQTIAVLGSGVDVLYPPANRGLAQAIFAGRGAIVSEYPLGSRPLATNFPGRNRIISGLASGVIVIEAAARSGALITAEYALQEGRAVFAAPGRPTDPRAAGNLALLKQGAVLVTGAEDVLDELGWPRPSPPAPLELSPQEALLAQALAKLGTAPLDELAGVTGQDTASLLAALTLLELKGVVRADAGGRWQLATPVDER